MGKLELKNNAIAKQIVSSLIGTSISTPSTFKAIDGQGFVALVNITSKVGKTAFTRPIIASSWFKRLWLKDNALDVELAAASEAKPLKRCKNSKNYQINKQAKQIVKPIHI